MFGMDMDVDARARTRDAEGFVCQQWILSLGFACLIICQKRLLARFFASDVGFSPRMRFPNLEKPQKIFRLSFTYLLRSKHRLFMAVAYLSSPGARGWLRTGRLLLLGVLLWAISLPVAWAGALVLTDEIRWPQQLSAHVGVFHDARGQYSIEQLAAASETVVSNFHPLDEAAATIRHDAPRWLSVDLESARKEPLSLVFVPGSNNAGRIDYYVERHNGRFHHVTGDGVSLADVTSHDRVHGLAFDLRPGERVRVFARVETNRPLQLKPRLHTEASFQETERRTAIWDGLLFGGLLLLAWGAFLIAVLVPNRHFGGMAALCMAVAAYEATVRGYTKLYLWPESVSWAARSAGTLGLASLMFFLIFIVGITRSERLYLPLRHVLSGLAVVFAAMITMLWLGLEQQVAVLTFPVVIVYIVSVCLAAILLLKSGAPGGRLILLTGLFILGHSALRLMTWSNLLPDFLADWGVDDPTTHPLLALLGLALNVGVLAAWIIEIGRQRRQAREALIRLKQEESERLQKQVAQQTAALNRSLRYAHEETRRKSEMLSYIGHDLRAPLATIVGHVRQLAVHSGAAQQEHVRAIERSAGYQLSLIDEILDYAKHELKPLEIRPVPTRLPEFLEDVVRHARSLSQAQNNQFSFETCEPLPVRVRVDAKRLQQILLNLISNAAKFTRAGSISLVVSMRSRPSDARLIFTVSDSGKGMTRAEQARLLNAFEQGEPRQGSVGLGLHIARRIISNMGGELELLSRPGVGSDFRFTVPVESLSEETFRRYESTADDDEREDPAPRAARDEAANESASIPPVELRVDLAKFARDGQLTDIEAWLDGHTRQYPEYADFFRQIEAALQELNFELIEAMSLKGLPSRGHA